MSPRIRRYLVKETVLEEVALAVNGDRQRADTALEQVGLGWAARASSARPSSGERERVALAAVAVSQSDLLVLDEPTRGLDPERKATFGAWLAGVRRLGEGRARRDARPGSPGASSDPALCFRNTRPRAGAERVGA